MPTKLADGLGLRDTPLWKKEKGRKKKEENIFYLLPV
jgi:hypothetical protein